MLLALTQDELDGSLVLGASRTLVVLREALGSLVERAVGDGPVVVAVSVADYSQTAAGEAVLDTRSAKGLWWVPRGHDTALVGTWVIDGRAMTVETEAERLAPIAEDVELLERATRRVAEDLVGADFVRPGVLFTDGGQRTVRVVVTRDARVSRPEDLLTPEELESHRAGVLGLASVFVGSRGLALVRKIGV